MSGSDGAEAETADTDVVARLSRFAAGVVAAVEVTSPLHERLDELPDGLHLALVAHPNREREVRRLADWVSDPRLHVQITKNLEAGSVITMRVNPNGSPAMPDWPPMWDQDAS